MAQFVGELLHVVGPQPSGVIYLKKVIPGGEGCAAKLLALQRFARFL